MTVVDVLNEHERLNKQSVCDFAYPLISSTTGVLRHLIIVTSPFNCDVYVAIVARSLDTISATELEKNSVTVSNRISSKPGYSTSNS